MRSFRSEIGGAFVIRCGVDVRGRRSGYRRWHLVVGRRQGRRGDAVLSLGVVRLRPLGSVVYDGGEHPCEQEIQVRGVRSTLSGGPE
eukprot:3491692-Pleurochrysis_carterae.AAC.1